ncbi:hypothetical protein BT93_L0848 [Corymbia citriodora subsp. variegata]|uniref:DUF4220 domain-containing protein n=1 Tax=Corymbia citriodora subsp. variegata TaxID=360336 RepID=A0A8T0CTX1_CORYI|nr:hypothetical protein BT93_L0848 [Corymbia citriodora subsp. variegata]
MAVVPVQPLALAPALAPAPKDYKWTLEKIELLLIITAFLLLFLFTLGSCRRRCSSRMFQRVIFAAYTLSTYIFTYALGLMQNAQFDNELFPIWAVFMGIVLASTDSISAYSLEDNEKWKSYNWQLLIKVNWLVFLLDWKFETSSKTALTITYLLTLMSLKTDERARALMAGSRQSLERDTKVVADYMRREHESGEVDPVHMSGYTYLVRGEEERWEEIYDRAERSIKRFIKRFLGKENHRNPLDNVHELITIEKVWKCEGRLLSSEGDPNNEVKDICLSFALFKLLHLRYAGYSLPQEAHKKTRNLIHRGLLSKEDGYKRAFRVVEDELTFLFDFFFTKYSMIFQPGRLYFKLVEFIYVAISIWFTASILKYYNRYGDNCQLGTVSNGMSIEVVVTSLMMISFILVEFMQFFFVGFSEWAKVILICKLLNNTTMAVYIDQTRNGQRESTPVKLPEEVKEAVFHALKSNYSTKLENGQASLRVNNESKKLLWACQFETHTQAIIVWHIATSFWEHQLPLERLHSPATRRSFLVATSLSKYLAYLVAFAPSLLPDHPYTVECMFDQAIIEARDFFRKCKRMKDRVKEMKENNSGLSAHGETVINQGARLGNQLVNDIKDKDMIWRILADFWAELVLYVAPSDNAKAHGEHLTRGGEFVTHLWALLSHAGI